MTSFRCDVASLASRFRSFIPFLARHHAKYDGSPDDASPLVHRDLHSGRDLRPSILPESPVPPGGIDGASWSVIDAPLISISPESVR